MGNPAGIALFYYMANLTTGDSKLRVMVLAAAVSAVIIVGSIAVVRYANRDRQVNPAIESAAQTIVSIPAERLTGSYPGGSFITRRDEFANQLMTGALPVDSVRAFYHSYALWMRDGRWDSSDVAELSAYLGVQPTH